MLAVDDTGLTPLEQRPVLAALPGSVQIIASSLIWRMQALHPPDEIAYRTGCAMQT
jgi:hypothetical protein